MKQERFIEGIWEWMVKEGLVDPDLKKEYEPFLNMIWVAGFDYGRKQSGHGKKVVKMDQWGHILKTYDNATEAANETGVSKHMISKVCLGKNSTAGLRNTGTGYYFKYIDDEKTKF
jgi:hypothetical protein